MKPVVAVFDFDGTVTRGDSLLPFLRFVSGTSRFCRNIARVSPVLTAYALRIIPNDVAKERLLSTCLAGMRESDLTRLGHDFAESRIPLMLKPAALTRLQWHLDRGDRCVLASASPEIYLCPWGSQVGFSDVIGTRLEVRADGTLSGRFAGRNCYGAEKVARLTDVIGNVADHTVYCYGNSRGDLQLLALADYAFYRFMPAPQC